MGDVHIFKQINGTYSDLFGCEYLVGFRKKGSPRGGHTVAGSEGSSRTCAVTRSHLCISQRCSLFSHGEAKDVRGHLQNQVFNHEEFSTMEIMGKATQTQRKKTEKGYTPKMLI